MTALTRPRTKSDDYNGPSNRLHYISKGVVYMTATEKVSKMNQAELEEYMSERLREFQISSNATITAGMNALKHALSGDTARSDNCMVVAERMKEIVTRCTEELEAAKGRAKELGIVSDDAA